MNDALAQAPEGGAARALRADAMDVGLPTRGDAKLSIVGLSGSVGGIAGLQEFFAAMPVDSGMTFVVILHLSPHHENMLAEIFQGATAMRVVTATECRR